MLCGIGLEVEELSNKTGDDDSIVSDFIKVELSSFIIIVDDGRILLTFTGLNRR